MVEKKLRSTSAKKTQKKTPGGKTVTHYKKEKPRKHVCARCEKELQGTPNANPNQARKMKKSERRPSRIYAGNLCADCTEELLRYETRFMVKFNYPEYEDMDLKRDLTIEKFLPRGWYDEISGRE